MGEVAIMKVTKKQLRRIIREVSASRAMLNKAREVNRGKAADLFQRFDDLGHRLAQMSNSDPDYENVSDDYDILEDELEDLGYEIPSSFNPFRVDSGKIRDKATGEIVHTRQKRR